jgi:hypothetical protein
MLSIDLTHLPIKTEYDFSKDRFKPVEIAEVILSTTYRSEYARTLLGLNYEREVPVAERKDLVYVAGLNPKANVLITGHPSPDTNEFIDPTELRLDNILKYTPLRKIK